MVLNYIAILVASVVSFLVGMVWYSPLLFGKVWIKLIGISKEDMEKSMKKGMATSMLLGFVTLLVMSYVLRYFIEVLRYSTAIDGVILGFMIWIGFFATSMMGIVLWENKPWGLYLINTLHYLVVLVIMGAILGAWV